MINSFRNDGIKLRIRSPFGGQFERDSSNGMGDTYYVENGISISISKILDGVQEIECAE